MRKYMRWSHNQIFELLQKNLFLAPCEVEYWIMKDYTHAQILRRAACRPGQKRTIKRGLWFIKRSLTELKKFKNMKAKLIMGGIQVERSPTN